MPPAPLDRFQPALDRLLAKEPEERFASAEELVEAIQDAATGKTAAISRQPERRRPKPIRDMVSAQVPASASPPWRRALPWILAGLLAGLAGAGLLVLAARFDRAFLGHEAVRLVARPAQ